MRVNQRHPDLWRKIKNTKRQRSMAVRFPAVEVEFLEWTDDLRGRHPRIIGWSSDSPESCTIN
jgi:hypothetical protein